MMIDFVLLFIALDFVSAPFVILFSRFNACHLWFSLLAEIELRDTLMCSQQITLVNVCCMLCAGWFLSEPLQSELQLEWILWKALDFVNVKHAYAALRLADHWFLSICSYTFSCIEVCSVRVSFVRLWLRPQQILQYGNQVYYPMHIYSKSIRNI